MGNRTQTTDGVAKTQTNALYNRLNQLTGTSSYNTASGAAVLSSTAAYGYDGDGNMSGSALRDAGGVQVSASTYSYDEESRLVGIETPGQSKWQFVYDGMSRLRVSRSFAWQGGAWVPQQEIRRVYDGMDVVQERDASNNVVASYTRTGNIGGILARTTSSSSTFYGYDLGGNVTTLTDISGAQVGSYTYDAWGNTVASSGARAGENPYRFSSKEALAGFYSYGYRFYAPGLGRWINRDPIEENGGVNLYTMVGNDPVNAIDSYGLAQVVLRWREVIGGANHSYLLIYETNSKGQRVGTPKYFGGYKGDGFTGPLSLDHLTARYGNYLGPKGKSKGSPDWGNPVGSLLMICDDKPASYYTNKLKGVAAKINAMNRWYPPTGALGPNSNSVARTYLNELGIQYPFYSATHYRSYNDGDGFVNGDVLALPYWNWVFDLKSGSVHYDADLILGATQ